MPTNTLSPNPNLSSPYTTANISLHEKQMIKGCVSSLQQQAKNPLQTLILQISREKKLLQSDL